MMSLTLVLLLFSLDLISCETSTSVLTTSTTPDQIPIESQLPLVAQVESTTSTSLTQSPKSIKTKTIKPSCRIVYKTIKAPINQHSSRKDKKLTMACTVCNFKGYKESCVYTDKKIVKDSDTTTPLAQESRQSAAIKSSTEPFVQKASKHYIPVFETTASSSVDLKKAEDEDDEEEGAKSESRRSDGDSGESGEDTKDEEKGEKVDFYGGGKPTNFIPKEYLDLEYDPKFYEGHDAAANVYHKVRYDDGSDESSEEDKSKESRKSYRHMAMPGFEELRKVLPDVEPINVDKVKPQKRQKTIEYNEETSFSSDAEDDNVKKSSEVMPSWDGIDSQGQSSNDDSYESSATDNKGHGGHGGHGDHGGHGKGNGGGGGYGASYAYKPPFDMPAFDTKNCKVTYKESPSGGPKMKCMNCKDESNAYSEECGVEYEEPTKHREVFYNKGQDHPKQSYSKKMGYGSHQVPVHYYHNPYYSYSGNKKNSESQKVLIYKPYQGFYSTYN